MDRISLGHETAGVERGPHRDWPECSEAGRTPLSSLRAGLLGHGCLDKHRVGPVSPEPAHSHSVLGAAPRDTEVPEIHS